MSKLSLHDQIINNLNENYSPQLLELFNESHLHNVPENSETHFKVVMVAEEFNQLRAVQRHQSVYAALADQLANGVHALALHLFSPEEWQAKSGEVSASPNCMGGSKS